MRVEAMELRQLEIPMVEPLAAAHGSVDVRESIFVRVCTDVGDGWGECVALNEPTYVDDWSLGELTVIKQLLAPILIGAPDVSAAEVGSLLLPFAGHKSARSAIEMAVLDAELRYVGVSLADYLEIKNRDSVECVVVVGLLNGESLLKTVEQNLELGYGHLRLKVDPGRDFERVDLIRRHFPETQLSVDANGSYRWADPAHRRSLEALDDRGLAFIEQPAAADDLRSLVEIRESLETPICLDESIRSVDAAISAASLGLCDVVGVKPGLVGGCLAAKEICDRCEEQGVPVSIGGYLETGLARSPNVVLAGTPAARRYPAVLSPDGRWFGERLTVQRVSMADGTMPMPSGPGLGLDIDIAALDRATMRTHVIRSG